MPRNNPIDAVIDAVLVKVLRVVRLLSHLFMCFLISRESFFCLAWGNASASRAHYMH